MPFKSEAQRRKFHAMAGRGEMSQATVKKWEDETPKKVKKKLPYHVKKASVLGLARLSVASNAFDFSQHGREKLGMNSVMITSFLDELEQIEKRANELTAVARGLGGVARTARQEMKVVSPALKSGITQAMPTLKSRASGMHIAGGLSHSKAGISPAKAMAGAAQGATNPGVIPGSLGGGGLTKTHIRPQAGGPSNLRRNLAIGGAVGGAAILGHAVPQHQQQQQRR